MTHWLQKASNSLAIIVQGWIFINDKSYNKSLPTPSLDLEPGPQNKIYCYFGITNSGKWGEAIFGIYWEGETKASVQKLMSAVKMIGKRRRQNRIEQVKNWMKVKHKKSRCEWPHSIERYPNEWNGGKWRIVTKQSWPRFEALIYGSIQRNLFTEHKFRHGVN